MRIPQDVHHSIIPIVPTILLWYYMSSYRGLFRPCQIPIKTIFDFFGMLSVGADDPVFAPRNSLSFPPCSSSFFSSSSSSHTTTCYACKANNPCWNFPCSDQTKTSCILISVLYATQFFIADGMKRK